MARPLIAVIGAGDAPPELEAMALELGSALAAHGLSLLCGGRGGVMAAAARGLREARQAAPADALVQQAIAIGLLPEDHVGNANPWLDIAIPTGLGIARNAIVARGSQGVIAVGGASGTLSELALAWQFGLPVCALAGSGGWAATLAGTALDHRREDCVFSASSPEAAANWAAALVRGT